MVLIWSIAFHNPYILAFDAAFIEVRHADTGAIVQIIRGDSMRLLYENLVPDNNATVLRQQQLQQQRFQAQQQQYYQYQQQQQYNYQAGLPPQYPMMQPPQPPPQLIAPPPLPNKVVFSTQGHVYAVEPVAH